MLADVVTTKQGFSVVDGLFKDASTRTALAPMAGYTDPAFRAICSSYGAALTVTEMVSSKAITMNNANTKSLLLRVDDSSPSFCQIFGHEPLVMAQSVQIEEMKRYEGIDINMGCPVRKIVGNGDGSALLENPSLASKCIQAVKLAIGNKPLSVKFRLGVDESSHAVDFAKMCRDSGADFITMHFRTRKQMYSGKADFTLLPQIAAVGLPVIANGDVATRQDYLRLVDMGAYGVAVGRNAVGRPWIFSEIAGRQYDADVIKVLRLHTEVLQRYLPQRVVNNEMKKHVVCYLKGMRGAKAATVAVMTSHSVEEMLSVVQNFLNSPQD